MESTNSLMEVTQLPVIKQRLELLGKEIDKKLKDVNKLAVTEENRKDVKKIRTEFRKEFEELEKERKQIKQMILEPYQQFEDIYNQNVGNKYKEADYQLKDKIDSIENGLIEQMEEDLRCYFNEEKEALNLPFQITFESMGLNITLSSSINKLRKELKERLERISSELELINQHENSGEILVEYLNNDFDFANAFKKVNDRYETIKKINEEKAKLQETLKIEQERIEKVEEFVIEEPVVMMEPQDVDIEYNFPDVDLLTARFEVSGTIEQLKALKEYLNENNIEFRSL